MPKSGSYDTTRVKLQGYATSSAFGPTKDILTRAHEMTNTANDPDPDLDVDPRRSPKWSTHSLRRLADTVARRYREQTGTSEAEIDIYLGWQERLLKKAMQFHYMGMSFLDRMGLSKVTGMM